MFWQINGDFWKFKEKKNTWKEVEEITQEMFLFISQSGSMLGHLQFCICQIFFIKNTNLNMLNLRNFNVLVYKMFKIMSWQTQLLILFFDYVKFDVIVLNIFKVNKKKNICFF